MVYIDLNMVRAGVVKHPADYSLCGYHEIQNPPERYRIIDSKANLDYFSIGDERKFQHAHRSWVEEELKSNQLQRNRLWSEAIAIGNEGFIEDVHHQLKNKTIVGKAVTCGSMTVLKEPHSPYNTLFGSKKVALSHKNTYYIELTCRN